MKKTLKKVLVTTGTVMFLLIILLAVHIYIMTRPKAPDKYTRAMARIDIEQDINQNDANRITTWLYQQKGIDHVFCNPGTDIVVFTFSPLQTSANSVVADFKSAFHYKAQRFTPSEKDIAAGCPVASTSFTYRAYNFIKHIF